MFYYYGLYLFLVWIPLFELKYFSCVRQELLFYGQYKIIIILKKLNVNVPLKDLLRQKIGWCKEKNLEWESISRLAVAAAAAKSLQLCSTLCDPIDGSPPGSTVPGILQAITLEWVAISFSNAWKRKVKVKLLSRVWLFMTANTLNSLFPLFWSLSLKLSYLL